MVVGFGGRGPTPLFSHQRSWWISEWGGSADGKGIYLETRRRVSERAIKATEGVNEDEVRPIKATDKVGGGLLSTTPLITSCEK